MASRIIFLNCINLIFMESFSFAGPSSSLIISLIACLINNFASIAIIIYVTVVDLCVF